MANIYGAFGGLFRDAIRDGVRRGEFRPSGPVDDVADRLISLMDGIAIRTLLGELARERMLRLLTAALGNELGLEEAQRRRLRGYISQRKRRT